MDGVIDLDSKLHELLKEFKQRRVENALWSIQVYDERPIVESVVARARELGVVGINDLRRVLLPESQSDSFFALGAAQSLAELEDGGALALVIYQAAQFWDNCIENGGQIGGRGGTFRDFLAAARKLMPHALKSGPLQEGIIKTLTIFVEHISDWRVYDSVFATAAASRHSQLKDALLKIAANNLSDDWIRRSEALFALRIYPEIMDIMLEATNHPESRFAEKAAEALVEMLAIVPGCGEKDYERWKLWALGQVPPELKPEKVGGFKKLLQQKTVYDRRQSIFWDACRRAHQKAMQK